jgi:hypothetical protein
VTDHPFPLSGGDANPPISWADVLKIWWLMTWRATIGSAATGMATGFFVAIIGLILGWPPLTRAIVILSISVIAGLVWRIVAVRMALEKRYSDFRLTFSRPA